MRLNNNSKDTKRLYEYIMLNIIDALFLDVHYQQFNYLGQYLYCLVIIINDHKNWTI
jgi:hypothetical protein